MSDTIFGRATAAGRAAIAVVRCSGPDVGRTLRTIAGKAVRPRTASLRALRDGRGEILDRALVLWFPGPASFTGEDCAELHLHGGAAVVEGVEDALLAAGLRPANPGEFTRRAFENGKLDLTQAEAIADLIDAESRAQARQAIGQMRGALGERYRRWRGALLEILCILEGGIDFADEAAEEGLAGLARPVLTGLTADLAMALAEEGRGRRVREGYRIALIGAANAGKSSLLNHLVGRPAAIVADTPGTTRDVIECAFDVAGYRVIVADTAGIRPACDAVEREGVRRASAWAREADLRLFVVDRSASESRWREAADLILAGDLLVLNKADLPEGEDDGATRQVASAQGVAAFVVSLAEEGVVGLAAVEAAVHNRVVADCSGAEFPAITHARHAVLLRSALDHLRRASAELATPELAAEDVRLAARSLSQITGEVGVEDVLDQVFSRFCIGK